MRTAALIGGLAILMASVVAAAANDSYTFVCKPGLTEVFILLCADTPGCIEEQKKGMYLVGNKRYPRKSPLFRFDQRGEKDTLHYRGRRCVGPF
jgi:hypothetical protein